MQASQNCPSCKALWYAQVAYCPYCSTAAADIKPPQEANEDPPAPHEPAPPEARPQAAIQVEPARETSVENPPVQANEDPEATAEPDPQPSSVNRSEAPKLAPADHPTSASQAPQVSDEPTKPAPTSKFKQYLVVLAGLVVVLSGLYFALNRSPAVDPCEVALKEAAGLIAAHDAAGARAQAVLSVAVCTGPAQARARDLLTLADKAVATQAACDRAFAQINNLVTGQRLQAAERALGRIDAPCLQKAPATELRNRIQDGQRRAAEAQDQVRQHLQAGNPQAASQALDLVEAANREHQGLGSLRREVELAVRNQEEVNQPVVPEQAPVQPPSPRAEVRSPTPSPNSQVNPQADLIGAFLRDAESALAQKRFDAAKTFVDSALRIDPRNTEAAALARRIREQELTYLKEGTTIR